MSRRGESEQRLDIQRPQSRKYATYEGNVYFYVG